MWNQISVVIQGPLGRKVENLWLQLDNLVKTGAEVIVSCFEKDDSDILNNYNYRNCKITYNMVSERKTSSNLDLQIYSTLQGIYHCNRPYLIKLRSDEFYTYLEPLILTSFKNPSKLVTSNIFFIPPEQGKLNTAIHISDHVLMSTRERMLNMWECAWNYLNLQGELSIEGYLAYSFLLGNKKYDEDYLNASGHYNLIANSNQILRENFDVVDINKMAPYSWSCAGKFYTNDHYLFENGFNRSITSMEDL